VAEEALAQAHTHRMATPPSATITHEQPPAAAAAVALTTEPVPSEGQGISPQPATAPPSHQAEAHGTAGTPPGSASFTDRSNAHRAASPQLGGDQIEQEGLAEVRSRLQSVLRDLPFQDVVDAISARLSSPTPSMQVLSDQTPASAAAATAVDQSISSVQEAATALVTLNTAVPRMSKTAKKPAGLANATAAKASTPAAEASTTAAAATDTSPIPSVTVPVICNGLRGVFDFNRTMVQLEDGKQCRPTKFEQQAGLAHAKKWASSIKVDEGDAVPGESIGQWLKKVKGKGKGMGGRPPSAKPRAAASVDGASEAVQAAATQQKKKKKKTHVAASFDAEQPGEEKKSPLADDDQSTGIAHKHVCLSMPHIWICTVPACQICGHVCHALNHAAWLSKCPVAVSSLFHTLVCRWYETSLDASCSA